MKTAAALFSSAQDAVSADLPGREGTDTVARQFVGQDAVPLTDESREAAIALAGKLMERRYADYAATGCFAALGDAHRAMNLQKTLIQGRSPEQVRKMEQERGLN